MIAKLEEQSNSDDMKLASYLLQSQSQGHKKQKQPTTVGMQFMARTTIVALPKSYLGSVASQLNENILDQVHFI